MTVVQALDKSFSANHSSMSGKTFGCVHHEQQLTLLLECLLLPFVKLSVTLLINPLMGKIMRSWENILMFIFFSLF